MPTVPAPFRARKPAVNFNQFSPIPLAFVSKLANQFAPASIANSKSKLMVLHHILEREARHQGGRQILNYNRLVFTNQLSRQLMQKIFSSIGNGSVDSSHLRLCLMSVVTPASFARQRLLHSFQLLAELFKMLGVSNLITVTGSNQTRYSHVQPNRFIGFWKWFNRRSSTSKDTNQRPSAFNLTVIINGVQPSGIFLLQRIGKASAHLANNTCPSLHPNF